MSRLRDDLLVYNERVKLSANTYNAVCLGLIGFALLRPLTEDVTTLDATAFWWTGLGLAFHALARYMLGRLKKEATDDGL